MVGEVTFRPTFRGPAGNNATMQCGAEVQGAAPHATFLLGTVFLGGAHKLGNGNTFGCGPSITPYRDCGWEMNLKVTVGLVLAMTGSRAGQADPRYLDEPHLSNLFPDNGYGVPVTSPACVPPPWWW